MTRVRRSSTFTSKHRIRNEQEPPLVTATLTVPASSSARALTVKPTPMPATAPSPPAQQTVAETKGSPSLQVIRYAAAVLKEEGNILEFVAPCFSSKNARIKKNEEGWILESSEFVSCTTGEQVFPIADDIVSRVNCILALYYDSISTLSVGHIYWLNSEGEQRRSIRGSIAVNLVSPKGLAELKGMSGTQPLGSAVLEAMLLDPAVNEALTLHDEGELGWSQVYDIIEFLGGEGDIVKAGYANRRETRRVRQTANHYRHRGSQKFYPLPPNPPALVDGTRFARNLLKRWIASRLPAQSRATLRAS